MRALHLLCTYVCLRHLNKIILQALLVCLVEKTYYIRRSNTHLKLQYYYTVAKIFCFQELALYFWLCSTEDAMYLGAGQ